MPGHRANGPGLVSLPGGFPMARAYVEIPLNGKKAAGRVALVDIDDYSKVMPYRWFCREEISEGKQNVGPYATTNFWKEGKHLSFSMHKIITGYLKTDHHDGNGLNNRKNNLRPGSKGRNEMNKRAHKNSTSSYKGVSWHRRGSKWTANITVDYKLIYLGLFSYELDAARAYDRAACSLFKEYALFNFPEEHQHAASVWCPK
jgi:hypothetical protein